MALADPPPATSLLSVHLLGPFHVQVDGQPLALRHSRKEQWLLALLTLRHNRDVERDWLAGTLWPESHQSRALLRDTLSDLRQALGSQASRLCSPTAHTLCLDLSGADMDIITFDAAIACGDQVSLEEAVSLYRGPLLEGCTEEWVLPERAAREQAYLNALETLADTTLARGDAGVCVDYLRRVTALDPLRESAQRTLMQALSASGDYAAATLAYRELRQRLHRELHAEPDLQTTALFEQLRQQARSQAQSRFSKWSSPARALRQEPIHDLAEPSPTTQIPLHNLPAPLSTFIGREQEIQTLQRFLSSNRLLTLTGAGGCGKTRLALQVASQLLCDFPNGVWLVELTSLSEPTLVPQSVSQKLGVHEQPGRIVLDTLIDYLRSKHLLLVLDNCEHLVQACAHLAGTLLRSCPHVKVLATSREVLKVEGEQPWRVPPLAHPNASDIPAQGREIVPFLMTHDACRLFVERSRTQRPEFTLNQQNGLGVAHLCQHLDGMPLAIELAAARVRSLSVEEICRWLDQRFSLLQGGSRSALPRHQTLQALIDWSYDLLSDPEKRLLSRLSVFAGGWTFEAAEQITGEREMLDLLTSLVDKSLVVYEESREGDGRYHLLETIRQYAKERLDEREGGVELRGRHRDYFLTMAANVDASLRGPEQRVWLEWLEVEHDNLRAAFAWCLQAADTSEAHLWVFPKLEAFWVIRGRWHEGSQWLEEIAHKRRGISTELRAAALAAAATMACCQQDYPRATTLGQESIALLRERGDKRWLASALNHLGYTCWQQQDYARATALLQEGLALFREVNNSNGIAWASTYLGAICYEQGHYEKAYVLCEDSRRLFQEIGSNWGMALSLETLGKVALSQNDYAQATPLIAQSLRLRTELGHKWGIIECLEAFAALALAQSQRQRASRLYGVAAALRDVLGYAVQPGEREEYDRKLAAVREALAEEAFAAAWSEGWSMTIEQAIPYALEEKPG